ncbi:glycosyltransferase [Clostridium sp.]|jgi:glycosyltransferase involved in cell wall biosynthesis|uniref:glycosyltransferase n=1 Tax=Clostridium sp. TaxID=1506 RepID=UPI0025C49DB1|nr:glycosyltransferase [Clostridium sp.]MCI9070570.1 glycosyltransferase family 4 protein [Clostridium sp.]
MHIMFIPSWYDNDRNKVHGSFFREQATKLQEAGVKITVAYNEIWPLTLIGKIKEKSGLYFNIEKELRTYRYKNYNFIPKHPLMFNIFDKRMEKLYKEIIKKEGKVDIIHAQSSLWGGISASYIAKKYNIPLVITEHSSIKRGKYVRKSYYKRIVDSYKSADAIIAVGNGLKNEIEELTNRRDIKVIGNLVDLSLFDIRDIKDNKDEFIFFSLAFLEGEKGFDTLIKSFSRKFKNKKARLIIGGDGTQREWLEGIAKSENIESQVTFVGALSREEVSKYMNKCDAFVLASRYETFGVVYIEALASGKPVIGTFNGGAEGIINENVGILTEIDNVDKLSDAMEYIEKNYKKYNKESLRKYCTQKFSSNVIINKIINVYKEVMK